MVAMVFFLPCSAVGQKGDGVDFRPSATRGTKGGRSRLSSQCDPWDKRGTESTFVPGRPVGQKGDGVDFRPRVQAQSGWSVVIHRVEAEGRVIHNFLPG